MADFSFSPLLNCAVFRTRKRVVLFCNVYELFYKKNDKIFKATALVRCFSKMLMHFCTRIGKHHGEISDSNHFDGGLKI